MKNGSKKKYKLRCKLEGRCLNRWLFLMLFTASVVNGTGCGQMEKQYQLTDIAMGTMLSINLYTNQSDGGALPDRLRNRITQLEAEELSWRVDSSEVGRINEMAGSGERYFLSGELRQELEDLFAVSGRSNGAFDCTIGAVSRLWNIDEGAVSKEAHIPSKEEVETALSMTGYEKLTGGDAQNALSVNLGDTAGIFEDGILLPEGMSLDLGAVGKGIACDRLRDCLEQEKVKGAVISVGGSILTYGSKPDGMPWQVGIVNPFDTDSLLGTLTLEGEWYISTSGDYERFVEVDGEVYHHIIDPDTGYPADSGLRSVTIVCKNGLLSDALSTACFVLGTQEGMKLAKSYDAEALFVDASGTIHMTEGMWKIFQSGLQYETCFY